ncbi:MAG: Epimerase family protein [Chlamydiae bacterium]|nr:Epimerase family protein [Chlamydiota bacterium]
MKILIAGSSGLIGSALTAFLQTSEHEVVRLLRSAGEGILWDPKNKSVDISELEGFDAVINLAGENIADSRWNEAKKKRMRDSRVETTRFLCETFKKLENPPKVLVNASALGYYGNVPEGDVTESHPAGKGFLADVCQEWEEATECLMGEDMRIVLLRTGVVLSPKGGALKKMLTPFKLGIGGVIGNGDQMMSWIDIEDLVRAIYFCIKNDSIRGPVNVTAPQPVSNREFTKTLGKVLFRPTIFPMPAFAARLAFGEMADEMILTGAKILPERLTSTGFEFKYPTLESSLNHLLK